MRREITQGMLDRYQHRMVSLSMLIVNIGSPPVMGRRAQLKAMRDAMTPKYLMRDARRAAARRK